MKKFWIIAGAIVAAGAVTAAVLHHWKLGPFAPVVPLAEAKTEIVPSPDEGTPAAGHVSLTAEQIKNAQIQTEAIVAKTFSAQMQLLGVLQEDPDTAFVLRAPASGTIQAGDAPWPRIGQALKESATIGKVEPRLVPADQIALASQRAALQTQLASAQAEVSGATAARETANTAYQRLKSLNAQDKNVSDRVVEDALAKLQAEEARLSGARQTLELATKALGGLDVQVSAIPLRVSRAGQVAEVSAHPGEAIEPGQQIVRLIDPSQLIAALNFPSSAPSVPDLKQAHIYLPGQDEALTADIVAGATSSVDPKTRERIVPFHLSVPAALPPPAPGTPITARIDLPGEPKKGFAVPHSAVVRYQGKAWVYIKAHEDSFDRMEVSLEHPLPDGSGWFANEGFKGEEQVVTSGASVLLSHELIVLGG